MGNRFASILSIALVLATGVSHAQGTPLERGAELLLPFKKELKSALLAGLEQGPVEAISVCREQAPEIADSLMQDGIRLGRSSHRLRNPDNTAPDWVRPLMQQYLDSDDLLMPEKFALQVAGLDARRECGASYGKTRRYRIGERPADVPTKRTGEVFDAMFPSMLRSRWWNTSTPLFRRSVCDAAGPWDSSLRNEEDWEYDCRMATLSPRLHYVAESICDVRDHDHGQMHRNEVLRLEREVLGSWIEAAFQELLEAVGPRRARSQENPQEDEEGGITTRNNHGQGRRSIASFPEPQGGVPIPRNCARTVPRSTAGG